MLQTSHDAQLLGLLGKGRGTLPSRYFERVGRGLPYWYWFAWRACRRPGGMPGALQEFLRAPTNFDGPSAWVLQRAARWTQLAAGVAGIDEHPDHRPRDLAEQLVVESLQSLQTLDDYRCSSLWALHEPRQGDCRHVTMPVLLVQGDGQGFVADLSLWRVEDNLHTAPEAGHALFFPSPNSFLLDHQDADFSAGLEAAARHLTARTQSSEETQASRSWRIVWEIAPRPGSLDGDGAAQNPRLWSVRGGSAGASFALGSLGLVGHRLSAEREGRITAALEQIDWARAIVSARLGPTDGRGRVRLASVDDIDAGKAKALRALQQPLFGLPTLYVSARQWERHPAKLEFAVACDDLDELLERVARDHAAQRIPKATQLGSPISLPAAEMDAIRQGYLAWLKRTLRYVPGGVTIRQSRIDLPLDQLYVSLRGYPGSVGDIRKAAEAQGQHAEPLVLQERGRRGHFVQTEADAVDLGRAFYQNRAMVVIGDPGSGKTTLLRWLALMFAQAMWSGHERVDVLSRYVDTDTLRPNQRVDFGSTRLPIYLRVADLVPEFRRLKGQVAIEDLLGCGVTGGRPVYLDTPQRRGTPIEPENLAKFFRACLGRQEAVVFLDGLDEVADPHDREQIVRLLDPFLEIHFRQPAAPGTGNQLVVTSRRIGYENNALPEQVARYTIEPLSDRSIVTFAQAWHAAYVMQRASDIGSGDLPSGPNAAARFLAQIFHPAHTPLRELASNPLMLSLLCIVAQEHGQALPESRSQLYEVIVKRGLDALFLNRSPENRAREKSVRNALVAIATKMHEETSNGLLVKRALSDIVDREIARQPDSPDDENFRLIVEGVGLLSERGTELYGFQHQTIQEYLAGLHLGRSEDDAPPRLLARAADPRWREVILFAMGALGDRLAPERFQALCNRLLDADESGVGLPLGAILVAQLTRDFGRLAPQTVRRVALRLLAACATASDGKGALASFAQTTLAYLATNPAVPASWQSNTLDALVTFVADGGLREAQTVARLVCTHGLTLEMLAEPLLSFCRQEDRASGWIINEALERIATAPLYGEKPLVPVSAEVRTKLKRETQATLTDTSMVQSATYSRVRQASPRQATGGIAAYLLPFREALETHPPSLAAVQGSVEWLQVILPLYGGTGHCDTPTLRQTLLFGRDAIASPFVDSVIQGRVAAQLDNEVQGRLEVAAKTVASVFSPELISRDSPLTPLLVEHLWAARPAAALAQPLRDIRDQPDSKTAQRLVARFQQTVAGCRLGADETREVLLGDTLMALLLLGGADGHQEDLPPAQHPDKGAVHRFQDETARITEQQRDPMMRGWTAFEKFLLDTLRARALPIHPPAKEAATESLEDIVPEDWPSDTGERAKALAGLWLRLVDPKDGQAAHRLATVLDTRGRHIAHDPRALLLSWALVDPCRREGWAHPPGTAGARLHEAGVSHPELQCLASLAGLPHGFEMLRLFALKSAEAVIDPSLRPLAATVALGLASQSRRSRNALASLLGSEDLTGVRLRLFNDARSVADPLVRFWTLHHLGADRPQVEPPLLDAMVQAARSIEGIRARIEATVQLLPLVAATDGAAALHAELISELRRLGLDEAMSTPFTQAMAAQGMEGGPHAAGLRFDDLVEVTTALATARRISPYDPTSMIAASPLNERAGVLSAYWKRILVEQPMDLAKSDPHYSIAVVMDTMGKTLGASIDVLLASFAKSLPFAIEQKWDADGLVIPSTAHRREAQPYVDALLFLALIPARGTPLVAWSLAHVVPFLQRERPDLVPMALVIAVARLASARLRAAATRGLVGDGETDNPHETAARAGRGLADIDDPVARFHTARLLRKWFGDVVAVSALSDAARAIGDPEVREQCIEAIFLEYLRELWSESGLDGVIVLLGELPPSRRALVALCLSAVLPEATWREVLSRTRMPDSVELKPRPDFGEDRTSTVSIERCIVSIENALQHLPPRSPEQAASIAQVVVGLRLDALTRKTLRTGGEFDAWTSLLSTPLDAPQWATTVHAGMSQGLHLGGTQAQGLVAAAADPSCEKALHALLPLVLTCDMSVLALLQDWITRQPDSLLGGWSAVMLAEQGRWNPQVVRMLFRLLLSTESVLRNRAWMALVLHRAHWGYAAASRLRLSTLLAIGEQRGPQGEGASAPAPSVIDTTADRALGPEQNLPHTSLVAVWAFENIGFDDAAQIRECARLVESADAMADAAAAVLASIGRLTASALDAVLDLLGSATHPRVTTCLIRTTINIWYSNPASRLGGPAARIQDALSRFMDSQVEEIREAAHSAMAFFADEATLLECIEQVKDPAQTTMQRLRLLAMNAEIRGSIIPEALSRDDSFRSRMRELSGGSSSTAMAALELAVRCRLPLSEVRQWAGDDSRLVRACFAATDGYRWGRADAALVESRARDIQRLSAIGADTASANSSELFKIALQQLDRCLQRGRLAKAQPADQALNMFPLCGALAELMPDLYRQMLIDDVPALAGKLAFAAARTHGFPARQAAIVMLTLARSFSLGLASALGSATSDVNEVQQTALRNIDRVREIDPKALAGLNDMIASPNATIAYFGIRITLAILANDRLLPQQRETFRKAAQEAVADALRGPSPWRVVSILEKSEQGPELRVLGLLQDFLQDALVKLSCAYLVDDTGESSRSSRFATLRFKAKVGGDALSHELRIGDRPAKDPTGFQSGWLKATYGCEVPVPLVEALTDLAETARVAGVSCAELLDAVIRGAHDQQESSEP